MRQEAGNKFSFEPSLWWLLNGQRQTKRLNKTNVHWKNQRIYSARKDGLSSLEHHVVEHTTAVSFLVAKV